MTPQVDEPMSLAAARECLRILAEHDGSAIARQAVTRVLNEVERLSVIEQRARQILDAGIEWDPARVRGPGPDEVYHSPAGDCPLCRERPRRDA